MRPLERMMALVWASDTLPANQNMVRESEREREEGE